MPGNLGNAFLTLKVKADDFRKGLDKAQKHATKQTGKMSASFKSVGASVKGAAGKVPILGGVLNGLLTPAGAVSAALGLTVGVLTKMVKGTLKIGRELGTLRETLGVSAEAIQIYRRAIEETNGDATAFDGTTLRLQRSIGDASRGLKETQDSFTNLGLSWEELSRLSPEEALKAVIGRVNEVQNPTDGASTKALLLGRSYASMGGFANLTTDEIENLTDSVKDSAVVISEDGVTNVDEFDQEWRKLRDGFRSERLYRPIGTKLIPKITRPIPICSTRTYSLLSKTFGRTSALSSYRFSKQLRMST